MSKIARIIGTVAAIVAIAASIALTFGATTAFGVALVTIAAVASTVSAVAMAVSQATMKPPDMKGSVSQVVLGMNMPVPIMLGLTYIGGVLVYDKSSNGPDNYDRTQIMVISAAGPIESFDKILADYTPINFATESGGLISGNAVGFYGPQGFGDSGYMWANSRKGARPDTAITWPAGRPPWTAWGANHKLSGLACYSITMEFDEDGVRYASGVPQYGVKGKGVKVYDPRLDSTYPGGSGSQRFATESTWAWSENPALAYLTYARGWFENGVKICGCGLPEESLQMADIVEWANVCDANGWKVGGSIWDGAGLNRWDNLKRIAAAGGAEPVWAAGKLGVSFSSPKTPVFTITSADLADGEASVVGMQGFRDRINTVIPRVRLEDHRWEYIALDAKVGSTYLAEDGESKTKEIQYDLVQDVTQGAELASLAIADSRELGPVSLPLKPRFMLYRPGEAGIINLPQIGLNEQLCVITSRTIDPATGIVTMTFRSETTAKHAWALSQTGAAPPTPTLVTPQQLDEAVSQSNPALGSMDDLTPITIQADHTGTVTTGQLPRYVQAVRRQAGVDVTSSSAWSLAVDSGTITATIGASTGLISITAISSTEAVLTATSSYGGVSVSRKLKVTRQNAAAPVTGGGGGGGGSAAYDTSFASITSTAMAPISNELSVVVGPAGSVTLSCSLDVSTAATLPNGTYQVYGRWQHYVGGSWIDLGVGETADTLSCLVNMPDVEPGYLVVNTTKTGLTPGTTEKFRLVARKASGTREMTFNGSASADGTA